ncbi:MAG: HD domain-containing protein [Methylococcales bacterium]
MNTKQKEVDASRSSATGARFGALWKRCLRPNATMDASQVYRDLVNRYAEPGRFYHTGSHVGHCLLEFDRAASRIECPDAVELALWFHDAVFVPGARDNERRSAELLGKWGTTWFAAAFVDKVCKLILMTTHRQPPEPGDESYLVDIDLSSFGLEWPDFMRDTLLVRKEQSHVPDAVYYPAHAKFLQMLLDRPRIFYTDFFRERYEQSARRNITRSLTANLFMSDAFEGDQSHGQ